MIRDGQILGLYLSEPGRGLNQLDIRMEGLRYRISKGSDALDLPCRIEVVVESSCQDSLCFAGRNVEYDPVTIIPDVRRRHALTSQPLKYSTGGVGAGLQHTSHFLFAHMPTI